jgi:hypothetical protein
MQAKFGAELLIIIGRFYFLFCTEDFIWVVRTNNQLDTRKRKQREWGLPDCDTARFLKQIVGSSSKHLRCVVVCWMDKLF